MLRIIDTGSAPVQSNMDEDERLFETLDPAGDPLLHLYEWRGPSATYGYFSNPANHLDLVKAKRRGLELGRRPTGGGIVFHIWDWAFSFLLPSGHAAFSLNTLENYRFVNEAVLESVSELFYVPDSTLISENVSSSSSECQNFCMAKPTRYDVVYRGKKIAGAAQRRGRQGFLHQGTISLAFPHLEFLRDVLRSAAVIDAMTDFTFAPLGALWTPAPLQAARKEIREKLSEKLMEKL